MSSTKFHPKIKELYNNQDNADVIVDSSYIVELLYVEIKKLDIEQNSTKSKCDFDQDKIDWIRALEDLLLIVRYELVEEENIEAVLNDHKEYENCVNLFIGKVTNELDLLKGKKNKFINRVILIRFGLTGMTSQLTHISDEIFNDSLLRKARNAFKSVPNRMVQNYRRLEKSYFEKVEAKGNILFNSLEELMVSVDEPEVNLFKTALIVSQIANYCDQVKETESKAIYMAVKARSYAIAENSIFVRFHKLIDEKVEEKMLLDNAQIKMFFYDYTNALNIRLNSCSTPEERLNIIVTERSMNSNFCFSKNCNSVKIDNLPQMALTYLNELPQDIVNVENSKVKPHDFEKIKTILTVDQLALLFRLLTDLPIFENDIDKTNLSNVVISAFSTKQKQDISFSSFYNKMATPKISAVDYWDGKGQHIQSIINKYKENISK